ncbi:MAG: hypothetical protein OXT09_26420 [Myxococcales bacterium]|nr:hypothetical protein [Myxococcales bacterium]
MEQLATQSIIRWEGIADGLLRDTGPHDGPVDAIALALRCGLTPVPSPCAHGALSPDGTLFYPAGTNHRQQQRKVARKVARWLLAQHELAPTSEAVTHVAAALLLPETSFRADLARHGWNLRSLKGHYPNVTLTEMTYRVAMLHEAAVAVFDHGIPTWRRVTGSDLEHASAAPTRFETHLAELAFESEVPIQAPERLWAIPLSTPGRILTVCDAKQLLPRVA